MTNEMEQKWGIKVFAKMFGVTPRTIRFYEDKGLLTPSREGGVRIFGPRDRLRFEKIMRGKRLGFSLEDIRAVFDITDGTVTDRVEVQRRKENFESVLASLAERRRDLDILHKDMTEVISIADEALSSEPGSGSVADLAARYQAAFDEAVTGNPIDFLSGSPGDTPNSQISS